MGSERVLVTRMCPTTFMPCAGSTMPPAHNTQPHQHQASTAATTYAAAFILRRGSRTIVAHRQLQRSQVGDAVHEAYVAALVVPLAVFQANERRDPHTQRAEHDKLRVRPPGTRI